MISSEGQGLGSAGSSAVAGAGGTVATIGLMTGNPLVVAVGGLIALGASIAGALHIGEGCGSTCVQATSVVNSAEPTFRMNLDAYEQGTIDQSTALNNFTGMWTAIQQSCGAIPGVAGQNCVGDRQQGACKWKQTATPQYPGQPQMGECWNWWNGYHDPLTLPSLVPFAAAAATSTTTTTTTPPATAGTSTDILSSLLSNPLWLGAGLVVVGLALSE